MGSIPAEYSHDASSANYSIDGGPFTTFQLDGLPANTTSTLYNQIFFTTPELPNKPHSLLVTYLGNDSQTPLILSNILFTVYNSNPSHTGAIAGGVLGFFVLALAFFLLSARCSRRQQKQRSDISPFMVDNEKPLPSPLHQSPDFHNLTSTRSKPLLTHSHNAGPLRSSALHNRNKEPRSMHNRQTMQNNPHQNPNPNLLLAHCHTAGPSGDSAPRNQNNPVGITSEPQPTIAIPVLGQEAVGANPSPVDAIIHRYEDSGLRMTETEGGVIRLELPPAYTPM